MKKISKYIAVICSLSLLISMCCIGNLFGEAEDVEKTIATEIDSSFTKCTLSDFGITDTIASKDIDFYLSETQTGVEGLDKVLFSAYVKFNYNTQLHYGTQNGGKQGLGLYIKEKTDKFLTFARINAPGPNITAVEFDPTVAGIGSDTFNGTLFLLQISTELVDDTIKFGFFFNGKLYDNKYITVDASKASYKLGSRVNFYGDEGECYSLNEDVLVEAITEGFGATTLSDAGVADGNTSAMDFTMPIDGLDKNLFSANVLFNTDAASSTQLHFANTDANSNGGLTFYINGNNDETLHLGTLSGNEITGVKTVDFYPLIAGVDKFGGQLFKLQITTEFVDNEQDGNINDLKLGVFFDGKLYNGNYIYYNNIDASMLGRRVNFTGIAGEAYSARNRIMLSGSDSADFDTYTLNDLGIPNGNGNISGMFEEKLNKFVLGMNLKLATQGAVVHIASTAENGNNGIGIKLSGKNLLLTNDAGNAADAVTELVGLSIIPKIAGLGNDTFENHSFTLLISIEKGNFDKQADADDIKLGVFINGYLYNGEYIYVYNQADLLGKGFNIANATENDEYESLENDSKPLPKSLQKITLSDAGISDGTGTASGSFASLDTVSGTLFSAKLKFKTNSSRIHYGVKNISSNVNTGICLKLDGSNLILGNDAGNTSNAVTGLKAEHLVIDPRMAGVGTSFADTEFLLQITVETVNRNDAGGENDIKLGLFFEGKLYNNAYIYINDQADRFGNGINLTNGGLASFASYDVPNSDYTFKNYGIAEDTYSSCNNTYVCDDYTLDSTNISGMVTFPNASGNYLLFGGSDCGVKIEPQSDGDVSVSYIAVNKSVSEIVMLSPDVAGTDLVNNQIKLMLSFGIVEKSKQNYSLSLKIYINGVLYQFKAFEVNNVEKAALKNQISVIADNADIILEEPYYEKLSFRDYNITDTTYKNTSRSSFCDGETYASTYFEGVMQFSAVGGEIYLGGNKIGVKLDVNNSNQLVATYVPKSGSQIVLAKADPIVIGKELVGEEIIVGVKMDIFKETEKVSNFRAKLYVDGVAIDENGFTVKNVDVSNLVRNISIYSTSAKAVISVASTKDPVDFTLFGFTENWRTTLSID